MGKHILNDLGIIKLIYDSAQKANFDGTSLSRVSDLYVDDFLNVRSKILKS